LLPDYAAACFFCGMPVHLPACLFLLSGLLGAEAVKRSFRLFPLKLPTRCFRLF